MIRVQAQFSGLSPLLMNPMSDEQLDMLRNRTRKPKVLDQSVEDEAREKLYLDDDGTVGIPALNLFACLAEAGREVTYKGRSKISTATSTKLPSFLAIEELFLPFTDHSEWVVDKRRGRNPNGGEAVCLIRPRFDNWQFGATFEIDESVVTEETVKELLRIAGTSVGLCDFRPACKGPFGRFKLAVWEVIEQSDAAAAAAGNGKASEAAGEAALTGASA